jgi:nucleoid DNA-binding protein
MKRKQLGRKLARVAHLSAAVAQDRVDEVVHDILRRLRAGEPVDLAALEREAGGKRLAARPAGGK